MQAPHAVDHYARGERVRFARDRLREFQPAAAIGEWLRIAVAEHGEETPRHGVAGPARIAADEDAWIPLRFAIGTLLGLGFGLWLALSPMAGAIADPYIKALNSMPRVILAPIFAVWFGLGIASKVALGVTLVFFIVFFNVYQGVREVSPVVLANTLATPRSGSRMAVGSSSPSPW